MEKIYFIYSRVHKHIIRLKDVIFRGDKRGFITDPYLFKERILLKWMLEVERVFIINHIEKFNNMLIYSNNVDDILLGELTILIQNVVDAKTNEEIELLGLKKVPETHNYFSYYKVFDRYDVIELSNKKSYIIRIYNLEENYHLPSGLSTAYFNFKNGFQSLGFMGVVRISENQFKYLFLSIEEKPNFLISHSELSIFKTNAIQAFHFFHYFLDLLNTFYVCRTDLYGYHVFAVDSSNHKKWKFRLDDYGVSSNNRNQDLSRIHRFIINTIDGFLNFFVNQILLNFFNNLKDVAEKLKNSKDKDYFVILTNMIKTELEYLMANDELIDLIINDELKDLMVKEIWRIKWLR